MEKHLAHSPTAVFILHSYQELKVVKKIKNFKKKLKKKKYSNCSCILIVIFPPNQYSREYCSLHL